MAVLYEFTRMVRSPVRTVLICHRLRLQHPYVQPIKSSAPQVQTVVLKKAALADFYSASCSQLNGGWAVVRLLKKRILAIDLPMDFS